MYFILIVLLRQLAPPSPASRAAHSCDGCGGNGGCRYELAHTIDLGLIHLHGGSTVQIVMNLLQPGRRRKDT
jgi:hypothetical protein